MLKIKSVLKNSIGEELGLEKGDEVLRFDGHEAVDLLDYLYYEEKDFFTITVRQTNGDVSSCEIEKEDFETCFVECLKEEFLHLINKKQYIYAETLSAFEYYTK